MTTTTDDHTTYPDDGPSETIVWVDADRVVLFRVFRWPTGQELAEYATRETPYHTWGPPTRMARTP